MKKFIVILMLLPIIASSQYNIYRVYYDTNNTDTVFVKDDSTFRKIAGNYVFLSKIRFKTYTQSADVINLDSYLTTAAASVAYQPAGSYASTDQLVAKQNLLGFIPYNSTNPNAYISSINAGNVTTALGFTPYNATNPNGYISSISGANVITALGFTPYNSTNPNAYISSITSGNVTTALGFTPLADNGNGSLLTGITKTQVGLNSVDNTSDANKPISSAEITALGLKQNSIPTGTTLQYFRGDLSLSTFPTTTSFLTSSANKNFVNDAQLVIISNTTGTNGGDNVVNSTYANDFRAANFVAGTNYLAPNGSAALLINFPLLNQNTAGSAAKWTTARSIWGNSIDGSVDITSIIGSSFGGTGNGFTKFAGPAASEKTFTLPNASATITSKVAQVDIAATASATATTTLFTPAASGMYRLSIYLKITTTGTSPVAGPVTITYTEPDGSVAQSHVMALANTSGAVVTTTVNNSTTTGTVNGSMTFYAKTGVAIQYAIAVSGTFGSGRYTAHITLEAL